MDNWFGSFSRNQAVLTGVCAGMCGLFSTFSCLASASYILDSQDVSRLEYYQKQGVRADVLVEDVWLDLSADRGAMFSAGSFILNKEEGDLSEELQKSLEQEAQVICAKGLKTVSARPPADQRTLGQTITFDAVLDHKLPNFSGGKSMPDAWLPVSEGEGETYIQRRYCASLGCETLCVVEARTGRILRPLTAEREWSKLKQLTAFEWIGQPDLNTGHINANGTAMWINKENDLYYIKLDGSEAKRLTSTPEAEELVNFSPDGRFLAYVSANDLWVVDVEEGTPRAITKDGSDTILNGKSSWVYYEEVYSRNWQAYWWSPDSRHLIFYRTDESVVPTFTLIDEIGESQRIITTRYPRAGEPNPRVTLAVADVNGGTPRFMDLHEYDPEGYIVTGAGFTADSQPWYIIQDRAQKWLDFYVNGEKKFRDSTPAWIEPPLGPIFLKNGNWVATSTRDGFAHIYLYESQKLGGKPVPQLTPQTKEGVKQLTKGPWEVRNLLAVDEENGWVYFTGTRDNLIGANFYRVNLKSAKVERLTWEPGSHQVSLSPNMKLFADSWSSRQSPGGSALRMTDGAAKVRTLHSNPVYALEEYKWGKSEQFAITLKDGYQMEVGWILPPDFDPNKKYPVWMQIYGGPEMPNIRDDWAGGRTSDQSLAAEGVIAFYADPRIASGKGSKYAWPCYKHVYVQEGADLAEAIEWLGSLPFVDKERIGLSGYSYGGCMTLWMMTRYPLFCAGIAGGSIVNEREYDSIYTERYMDTPQNNPEGYETSKILAKASDIHGKLLLVYGHLDDNVHPCNSLKFAKALQDARVQFDLMLYPRTAHAYGGAHHYQLMRDFIRENLKP